MHQLTTMRCYSVVVLTIFITIANTTSAFEACVPQHCGNKLNISYPFWISNGENSYCGYSGFRVVCNANKPIFALGGENYTIKNISYFDHSFTLVRAAQYEGSCNPPLRNLSLVHTPFGLVSTNKNLVFHYNCSEEPIIVLNTYSVDCANASIHDSYAHFESFDAKLMNLTCQSTVIVPINVNVTIDDSLRLLAVSYSDILNMGFLLNWNPNNCSNCEESGGKCGFTGNSSVCYCPDGTYLTSCKSAVGITSKKILIVVGTSIGGLLIIVVAILLLYRHWKKKGQPSTPSADSTPLTSNLEMVGAYEGVQIFSNEVLEVATESFHSDRKLGSGGFGTVYKGKLQDGRDVAIKRLNEAKARIEQFRNEIEILAKLRHPNLVILYGCTPPQSQRLSLVYEYIGNGTVADHLHGNKAKPGSLPWPIRLKIAIETASALHFLHRSDIIHRDVKTSNILLQHDYTVKLGDFGVARPIPEHVTHVSTACVGTIGYLDPEYYQSRRLSYKSDVYSFGVVLLELISSLQPTDDNRTTDEGSLALMAHSKIPQGALHELVDAHIGFDSDENVRRMVVEVAELAFRCIQFTKDNRPEMREVLDTLIAIKN